MAKTRRGKIIQNTLQGMKIMYNNINGVTTKQKSLVRIIQDEDPTIIGITETKLGEFDTFSLLEYGYLVKRVDRKAGAGGVLIAYKTCLKNVAVVVREEKEAVEMLWIKFDNGKAKLRVGLVYMPQEKDTKVNDLKRIYKKMEEQIEISERNKEVLMLMGDMNCKIGSVIEGNTEEVTKGGKVMLEMCKRHDLSILNAEEMCIGTWTRVQKEKKSVLDYMITNKGDLPLVKEVICYVMYSFFIEECNTVKSLKSLQ